MKGPKICQKVEFAGVFGGGPPPTTPFIGVG
jgi:hypothetical protein